MAAAATDVESAAVPKKGGRKMLVVTVVPAFLLVAGAGSYFLLFAGKGAAPAAEAHGAAPAAPASFIFNLPTMTINLNTEDGETRETFLRLSIALEVDSEGTMTLIQPKMAKVVDAFQVYLRELRRSDLEGSAGIYRLKEELLRRVNVAIAPQEVKTILFKEILVQ